MNFSNIIKTINNSKDIAIFSHINCDADAVGSSLALKYALEKLGKRVSVFIQEPINSNYNFMGANKNLNYINSDYFDLSISVDCPNIKRFGKYVADYKKIKNSINIDHHPDNENFAKQNIVSTEVCSASELIFELLVEMKVEIDTHIATCLYAGIYADTGRFMYGVAPINALKVATELMKLGADNKTVSYNLYQKRSVNEFNLFTEALNKTEFHCNGAVALVGLTHDIFEKTRTSFNDTKGIIDNLIGIDGVDICVLLTEYGKNEQMVSVRTLKHSANSICASFGGGGHYNASGCRIFTNFDVAKQKLINQCELELKNERNN